MKLIGVKVSTVGQLSKKLAKYSNILPIRFKINGVEYAIAELYNRGNHLEASTYQTNTSKNSPDVSHKVWNDDFI